MNSTPCPAGHLGRQRHTGEGEDDGESAGGHRSPPTTLTRAALARFEREAVPLLDRLYAAARQMTCTGACAEGLVQQTYRRTLDALGSRAKITDLRVWMFRTLDDGALRACGGRPCPPRPAWPADQARDGRRAGQRRHVPALLTLGVQALDRLPDHEVTAALEQLPLALRMVVYLADAEDFSPVEIAEILGLPLSTVTAHLRQGRLRLVRMLADTACRRGLFD
ncbi:sigma factor-like helix-turn-helix DNA-binding protein [Streptomyces sp. NPDC005813]|uniref:sigma factor-like helix-turn-helix DNA-binding protein n=1 Tax=Streptomyces sp. NPDC005813 TaxID=3155592 RepID=UPI00340A2D44